MTPNQVKDYRKQAVKDNEIFPKLSVITGSHSDVTCGKKCDHSRVVPFCSDAGDTVASGVRLGADTGWVRVWTGAPAEDPARGTLVYLTSDTAVRHVSRDLLLAPHLTLWLQYGGGEPRRLRPSERPLQLQDAFLTRLGYTNATRRARVGIDPGLRHLVRVTVGPAAPGAGPAAVGALRSGTPLLLKGTVFHQWRRRPVLLLADRMFIYPGDSAKTGAGVEALCLGGGCGSVSRRAPRGGRLVMRVAAKPIPVDGEDVADVERHIFLGFSEPCERDMWAHWLTKVSQRLTLHQREILTIRDDLVSVSSRLNLVKGPTL